MGGTSPMCFSPIKIGQKEEETKKASFLHPLHRIWPHFWLQYKRQISAAVVKADEFCLNSFFC